MLYRLSFASFSILTLACWSANAAGNDGQDSNRETSPGWTEAPEESAAPEPAAEPEKAEPEKSETKTKTQTVTVKVSNTTEAEAERDKAPEPGDARKHGEHLHDGFYLRLSLGGGSINARGERTDVNGNRSDYNFLGNALSGDFMIGGTPARGLVLGGAYIFNHAARERDASSPNSDALMSFGMVGPFIDYYPEARRGFHLGAAMGPAATITYDKDQQEKVSAFGFGGSAWVGYDIWIGKQWSIGGIVRATGARVETPEVADRANQSTDRDQLAVGSVALLASIVYH